MKTSVFYERDEIFSELENLFEKNHIQYEKMTKTETESFAERWFCEIVPPNSQKAARKHCFSADEYQNFLWHAFSYEYIPCFAGKHAKKAFDNAKFGETVLYMENDKIGYKLSGINGIKALDLDSFMDIIITDKNFKRTYVHTHEEFCGPYFWERTKTN